MPHTNSHLLLGEESLDPQDWNSVREAAHLALDTVLDYQMNIRDHPAWQQIPQESAEIFRQALPEQGSDAKEVVKTMLDHVVPYPAGHAHPRFWGWVCGTGTPIGMIADMLAAGVNASAGTFNDAATRVENQVLEWMRQIFQFPEGSSGIITSGASIANVIGIAVARDAILKDDIHKRGLGSLTSIPTVYASTETHSSVAKALMLLGLGQENLRMVPVDAHYRIQTKALMDLIETDRHSGKTPIAIIGNAGTVNTGAIDDLESLAAIARQESVWFHVDGAIGALAVISKELRDRFKGLEQADSIAFDFHKWLYVPYEAGCVILRDGNAHRKSFTVAASYLEVPERGVGAMDDHSNIRGPQLSRGFKALKVWAQLQQYGLKKLGSLMNQNVRHICYLASQIDATPKLERLSDPELNIICFRYVVPHLDQEKLNNLNKEILMRLQEQGIAVPSSTRLKGQFCLRVANTNHRSQEQDFDILIKETLRLGNQILQES